jgi:hypothetical protein
MFGPNTYRDRAPTEHRTPKAFEGSAREGGRLGEATLVSPLNRYSSKQRPSRLQRRLFGDYSAESLLKRVPK